jgi:hypothetical protein
MTVKFFQGARGFDGCASPDDNARFAPVAFRDAEAHRGLQASWDYSRRQYRRTVMRAYDFTIVVPHTRGSLANLAEEMGRENINVEGLCALEHNGSAIFHLLTTDKAATTRAISKVGYKVTRETEVIVERIEDRPGMLGRVTRLIADAGINLTTVYLATDTRVVLGCENVSALETAWKEVATVAAR